jgi:hypothetical protein
MEREAILTQADAERTGRFKLWFSDLSDFNLQEFKAGRGDDDLNGEVISGLGILAAKRGERSHAPRHCREFLRYCRSSDMSYKSARRRARPLKRSSNSRTLSSSRAS